MIGSSKNSKYLNRCFPACSAGPALCFHRCWRIRPDRSPLTSARTQISGADRRCCAAAARKRAVTSTCAAALAKKHLRKVKHNSRSRGPPGIGWEDRSRSKPVKHLSFRSPRIESTAWRMSPSSMLQPNLFKCSSPWAASEAGSRTSVPGERRPCATTVRVLFSSGSSFPVTGMFVRNEA